MTEPIKVEERVETLDNLVEKLYSVPFDTTEYYTLREQIRSKLSENEKYDEVVVCFPSKLNRQNNNDLNLVKGFINISENIFKSGKNYFDTDTILRNTVSEHETFIESDKYDFLKRNEVEYNPAYKQLITAGFIADDEKILLLQTNDNNRIKNKLTLVQGHLSWGPDIYLRSQTEYLMLNLVREFNEELVITDKDDTTKNSITDLINDILNNGSQDLYLIADYSNHIGIEHFGFVYGFKIEGRIEDKYNIKSGEPEKHDAVFIKYNELKDHYNSMDQWLKMVVDNVYRDYLK